MARKRVILNQSNRKDEEHHQQKETGTAPVEPERGDVRQTYKRVHGVIAEVMHDVRFGYAIESSGVRSAVEALLLEVLRDTDAAMYLALLNNTYADLAQRSVHVAIMSLVFGKCIGIPKDKMENLGMGALLCDVGMVRVPQSLYQKSGALTTEEFEQVRHHVAGSVALVKRGNLPNDVVDIISMHHERFDGTGYPEGRKSRQIPLLARMVQITSVYLALSSRRPYSAPLSMKDALARIYEESGSAFDPTLVQKFIRCVGVFPPGCVVELASGEVGVVIGTSAEERLRPTVRFHYGADGRPLPKPVEEELSHASETRRIVRALAPNEYQIVTGEEPGGDRLILVDR